MAVKYILDEELVKMVNQMFKAMGLPQDATKEKLRQYLQYRGWMDKNGHITEEGLRSGMVKKGPMVDLN